MTPMQEDRLGARTAVLIIAGLCGLCVLASLSGCLTPAKLAEMAQRADTLSKGAKTDECADAAANAASAVVVALALVTLWQFVSLPEHAADVAKAAKAVKGKATFIAAALGSVYSKELLDGDREREKKKDTQAKIKWDDDK